jgi:hypothetical protein
MKVPCCRPLALTDLLEEVVGEPVEIVDHRY